MYELNAHILLKNAHVGLSRYLKVVCLAHRVCVGVREPYSCLPIIHFNNNTTLVCSIANYISDLS